MSSNSSSYNYVAIAAIHTNQTIMKLLCKLKLESKSWRDPNVALYLWKEDITEGSVNNQANVDFSRAVTT